MRAAVSEITEVHPLYYTTEINRIMAEGRSNPRMSSPPCDEGVKSMEQGQILGGEKGSGYIQIKIIQKRERLAGCEYTAHRAQSMQAILCMLNSAEVSLAAWVGDENSCQLERRCTKRPCLLYGPTKRTTAWNIRFRKPASVSCECRCLFHETE